MLPMQVTDLLYQKHTQLERMAAEKAAQQLTMEREIDTAREYAERNHRSETPVLDMSFVTALLLNPVLQTDALRHRAHFFETTE